jgi:hypothetical protein
MIGYKLVTTKFMVADIFTKATDEVTFKKMRSVLRNESTEPVTARKLVERMACQLMTVLDGAQEVVTNYVR